MHIILADSIDGGILMILFFGGAMAASVLALIALIPAWRGNLTATLVLAGPAFIAAIVATLYIVWGYISDGLNNPEYELRDFLLPWTFLAGPPLVTSLGAVLLLWRRRAKAR